MKKENRGLLGRIAIHYMEGFDQVPTEIGRISGMAIASDNEEDVILTLEIPGEKAPTYTRARASMCLIGEFA